MKEEKFKINCKSCGSDKIQTTLQGASGYSNYTVMEAGKVAFKCIGCGKYGSTDTFDKPNELSNFNIRCLKCDSVDNWDYNIQDVDHEGAETSMWCKSCGNRIIEE